MTCARREGTNLTGTMRCGRRGLALIAKPTADLSLYASYSRSYLPQSGDQFSSLTDVTDGLKPERFDNYEVGAKWEIMDGLLATAAVYRLDRSNTRATDPLDPARTILTGKQRTRGVELGLERSVTSRWLIAGGYSFQNAKIVSATASARAGAGVPLVPRHSASLWNRYEVNARLGVGLGVIARSKSYASVSNAVKLPGYARVDAALSTSSPATSRRSSTPRTCSARIISRPRATTTILRRALPGRSRRPSATGSSRPAPRARFLISLRSRTNSARASCGASWSGMRSRKLGWTVTQHSPPSASFSGSPRTLPMVTALPNSDRAAVAPSATVTGGRISSRSWLDPPAARVDLARSGLAVDAPLAAFGRT